jgi:hypothetical protein
MVQEPQQRLMHDLQRAIDKIRGELARVELLAAALAGLSRPVPEYEPRFHHLGPQRLTDHELSQRRRV